MTAHGIYLRRLTVALEVELRTTYAEVSDRADEYALPAIRRAVTNELGEWRGDLHGRLVQMAAVGENPVEYLDDDAIPAGERGVLDGPTNDYAPEHDDAHGLSRYFPEDQPRD